MKYATKPSDQVERLRDRAKNAIAACLMRHLDVPNVYFEARWPSDGPRVDVLLIDRAGSGDVHVIDVMALGGLTNLKKAIEKVMCYPAQFRWVAALKRAPLLFADPGSDAPQYLYPEAGMGRVGLIQIVKMAGDELGANIRFKAERFRGNYCGLVDEFTASHQPDAGFW